jgi:hypothetical protein
VTGDTELSKHPKMSSRPFHAPRSIAGPDSEAAVFVTVPSK